MFPGIIETSRLVLRPVGLGEEQAVVDFFRRERDFVGRFIPFGSGTPEELAREFVSRVHGQWTNPGNEAGFEYGIFDKEDGMFAGSTGAWTFVEGGDKYAGWWTMGAWTGESVAGRGYGTEAVGALAWTVLQNAKVEGIVARVDKENDKSLRLCAQLGFEKYVQAEVSQCPELASPAGTFPSGIGVVLLLSDAAKIPEEFRPSTHALDEGTSAKVVDSSRDF
jgi:RimJ/RimL family protein N-acetyltransferase